MRQERLVNKIKKIHCKSWIFNTFWSIVWVLWPEAKIWGSLGMEKSSNMFYYLVVIHTTVITHILWFPSLCRVLFLWHCLALGFSCAQSPSFPLQSASICFLLTAFSLQLSSLLLFLLNLHQIAAQVRFFFQIVIGILPDRGWMQRLADHTSKLISSGNTIGKPLMCKYWPTVELKMILKKIE